MDTQGQIDRLDEWIKSLEEVLHRLRAERKNLIQSRDRVGGRPRTITDEQIERGRALLELRDGDGRKRYTLAQAAAEVGISSDTLWRRLEPQRIEAKSKRERDARTANRRRLTAEPEDESGE